jgi:hypothetical protein
VENNCELDSGVGGSGIKDIMEDDENKMEKVANSEDGRK